jgi:DNA polymerase-3 subunit gamma/tau
LSLLDQAIATAAGTITEAQVRDMLGLSDRTQLFDLFEALMAGEAKRALDLLGAMYHAGADPVVVLQDLLDLTHLLTRARITPEILDQPTLPETERRRGAELGARLALPVLARTWQMLLKGLAEAQAAPQALAAAEMALIRIMHVADLPTPGELVKRLGAGMASGGATDTATGQAGNAGAGAAGPRGGGADSMVTAGYAGSGNGGPRAQAMVVAAPATGCRGRGPAQL